MTYTLELMNREEWLDKRLRQQGGASLFMERGLMDTAQRKAFARAEIRRLGLQQVVAGGAERGKPETFAQVFKRIYGEELEHDMQHTAAAR